MDEPLLPHPITGQLFPSPVPPGTGWPQDPARANTPVATTPAQVARLARAAQTLEALTAPVSVCRACPRLVAWREGVAVGKRAAFAGQPYWGRPAASLGDPHPKVMIVGLAPAAHGANRTGRMFTGDRSGDWLFASLYRTGFASQPGSVAAGDGLVLRDIRISATLHCAPPDNRPSTQERHTCAPWLDRELTLATKVSVLVALGGIGWAAALGAVQRLGWVVPRPKPRFGHGAAVELSTPDGRVVTLLGSYHVSQQNTFTGRLTEPMLDEVFTQARRFALGG